jgi:large subunit ribosomal protein L14e|tara:strand:- start:103 stop:339 length:237 start_codon:yes stop_codon:yes gene_type:complete
LNIGRICIKSVGKEAGMKCVIVSIMDDHFALVDSTFVRRRRCNLKHLIPTNDSIDLKDGASTKDVEKALIKADVNFGE